MRITARCVLLSACLLGLTACAPTLGPKPPITSTAQAPDIAVPADAVNLQSARSAAVRRHYTALQAQHLHNGLLRIDGGAADGPITPRTLQEAFVRIALYDEYAVEDGRYIARERPARLRRWDAPVRIGLSFGPSVPAAQRQQDRRSIAALVRQLRDATGHPIVIDSARANLHVHILSEDERLGAAQDWARQLPGVSASVLAPAVEMGLETVCLALSFTPRESPVYGQALVVVRAELPDLLRLSCFHEEIAQALGLVNDWSRGRPTIFNDDEEFATLTVLDVLLLGVLYDSRLRPGMREAEARPILAEVVADILPIPDAAGARVPNSPQPVRTPTALALRLDSPRPQSEDPA